MSGIMQTVSSISTAFLSLTGGQIRKDDLFLRASELLNSSCSDKRVQGIYLLPRCSIDLALQAAQSAFQAYESGPESVAAQKVLLRLCAASQKDALAVGGRVLEIASQRSARGSLTLGAEQFGELRRTISALIGKGGGSAEGWECVDRPLLSWFERDIGCLRQVGPEYTLSNPSDARGWTIVSDYGGQGPIRSLNSLAILVTLMKDIQSPGLPAIRCELIEQIRPDGFGGMVLESVAPFAQDPQLRGALTVLATKWRAAVAERGKAYDRPLELIERVLGAKN
jgi:hypothetical protein